jgi:beta-D-xylosidase 4
VVTFFFFPLILYLLTHAFYSFLFPLLSGVPSCANDWLLGTVLRGAWEFDGYVTSDCDADSDVFFSHHYTKTTDEAVAAIVGAGTDVDCGGFMGKYTQQAITNGAVTEAQIDVLLQRLFRVRLRLGHFDPVGPLSKIGPDQVCNDYSIELARDSARQSVVLVKNTNSILPLNPATYNKAVIIGPLIDLTDTIGYYGSLPCFNNKTEPQQAILDWIPTATSIHGVPSVGSTDQSGIPAAAAAAQGADLVVLQIGSDLSLEAEGKDRTTIDFSDAQKALITAVTSAATAPVIAMVFSGGAMDISSLLSNSKIVGVIVCGQPSVQVVGAGDVIFGKTQDGRIVSPAGRMSQMTYPADYVNQVSMFEFSLRPGPSNWPPGTTPGRTYRFYTGTPVVPFGFGLSYTTWQYTPLPDPTPPVNGMRTVDLTTVKKAAADHELKGSDGVGTIPKTLQSFAANFWINVTNTGSVDSDDVVLGFMVPPGAGTGGVPLQELFGFERVFVPAGQTVTVYLGAQGVRFTQAGIDGVRRVLPGEYTVKFGVKETFTQGMGYTEVKIMAV